MSGDGPSPRMVAAFDALRRRLADAELSFAPAAYRDDAMSILVNGPGEYWEIDVLADGTVDVEIFASQGLSDDPLGDIDRLIQRSRDEDTPNPQPLQRT